jgi:mono/diheme cytochrome c family protein
LALGAPDEPEEAEGVTVDPMELARVIGPGRELYVMHCVVCHSLDGSGGVGQSLVGNERLLDTDQVLNQLLRGTRFMPRFDQILGDEEIALVATYIRNSWGNRFGLVEEEEVSKKR